MGIIDRGEPLILDEAARRSAPGGFVELSEGVVHFELSGPPEGQVVVLVHGFSVPYFVWDPTFQALTEAGFRTLRYDLYGRGFSDRPRVIYDIELFLRQLHELLEALDLRTPVDLAGLSMGGPIAAGFFDRYPELTRKLVLVDPVGFSGARLLAYRPLLAPIIGETLLGLLGVRLLATAVLDDFTIPEKYLAYNDQYMVQMRYRGFKRAILSTLRHGPLGDFREVYHRIGASRRPVMLAWGREDKTVPFEQSQEALEAMPGVQFHPIDHAGHLPHYERSDIFNPLLLDFLDFKIPSIINGEGKLANWHGMGG